MPRKRPALSGTNGTAGVSTLPDATTQVALYMRVSSEEQAERGTIEAQRDFLRQFATLYQLSIAEEYADDGVTGTIVLGERPEGRRLLQDIATGRFGCVLLYRVDRLGRSLPALLDAHTALSKAGITIRSATEPFDTSTPIGTFLFQLLGSMAELDKSTIIERMTRGRDRVAKHGRWTDGPVPFGYDLDAERHLTPSNRWVDALGMTEADAARDLFRRMAEGSTTVLESRRFNALGIPTTRRYGNGTQATVGKKWRPSRIIGMLNNPVYIGRHVFKSKYGDVAREVPALLPQAMWEQAREQLQRNRSKPKNIRTWDYLLRGLITCGQCGATYVGQMLKRPNSQLDVYYRCGNRGSSMHPEPESQCRAKMLRADWLDEVVWADCRKFILNPGEALKEAQQQLHSRMAQVAHLEQQRAGYIHALGEKAMERERILTLFRRGRVALDDAETQLDEIAREEADLRQHLMAIDAQKTLAEAFESHMTEARLLLTQLHTRLAEIEQTQDFTVMRQVVEVLVRTLRIDTHEGATPRRKHATVTITYAFSPHSVAVSGTGCDTETPRRQGQST